MVEYRGHISRWQIIKTAAMFLFCAATVSFNLFWIMEGLITGTVKSLRRNSHNLIEFSTDPGWFCFNISLRAFGVALFSVGVVLYWKKLSRELR